MASVAADPCREAFARREASASTCQGRVRPWVVLVAVLGSSLAFVDGTVVMVALPSIRTGLEASLAEMQWVVNAYALTLAAFMLLGGAAGDTYGRRRVFVAGVVLFGLASLACGLAGTASLLIAARALQGVGGALLVPGSLALISAHFPKDQRGRAIGTWAAASGIAAALGPILGGWLVDVGPWQTIFLINVPVAIATVALSLWRVPEAAGARSVAMDWRGGGLAVLGLAAVAYGLTAAGESGALGTTLLSLAAGAMLLAGFLGHEARTAAPMMPLGMFRERAFAGANGLTLLLYFALSGAMFFLPTALVEAHGYSAARAGSVFLPFTVVIAVLSRAIGGLGDRIGTRIPLAAGSLIAALSLALLGPAVASGAYWTAVMPVMALLGLGMGIVVAPLSTAILNAVDDQRSGVASGINNAVSRVAGLLAVAGLGLVAVLGFDSYIASARAPEPVAQAVEQAGFGAPLDPATRLDAGTSTAITDLKRAATVAGLTWVAVVCATAALASSLIAWVTLSPRSIGRAEPA